MNNFNRSIWILFGFRLTVEPDLFPSLSKPDPWKTLELNPQKAIWEHVIPRFLVLMQKREEYCGRSDHWWEPLSDLITGRFSSLSIDPMFFLHSSVFLFLIFPLLSEGFFLLSVFHLKQDYNLVLILTEVSFVRFSFTWFFLFLFCGFGYQHVLVDQKRRNTLKQEGKYQQ